MWYFIRLLFPIILPILFCTHIVIGSLESFAWPTPHPGFANGESFEEFIQPTASGEASSGLFGCVRNDGARFHEAIDIAPYLKRRRGEATDSVSAVHDGRIAHINKAGGNSGYGRYVVIVHDNLTPRIYSLYAHLARVDSSLELGDRVKAGETIGVMGRSAGGYHIPQSRAHLHFEVGLRISDNFQKWYDRQGYSSKNHHGNYNGLNLWGMDPLAYMTWLHEEGKARPLDFIRSLKPGFVLKIQTQHIPDIVKNYPELILPGVSAKERKGWELTLSGWGFPMGIKPLGPEALKDLSGEGDVKIVAVNRKELEQYSCRNMVDLDSGGIKLANNGRNLVELMFDFF